MYYWFIYFICIFIIIIYLLSERRVRGTGRNGTWTREKDTAEYFLIIIIIIIIIN